MASSETVIINAMKCVYMNTDRGELLKTSYYYRQLGEALLITKDIF